MIDKRFTVVFALVLAAACATETGSSPIVPGDQDELAVDDAGAVPGLDGDAATRGAGVRRMNIRELDASLRVAAGVDENGEQIFWNAFAGVPVSAFDDRAFGPALGKPDWVSVTEEGAAPSPLYTKFVQDMSRDLCAQMLVADVLRTEGDNAVFRFAPHDAAPTTAERDDNIRYLLLRFLGLEGAEAESRCHALAELYETVATIAADDASPWQRAWGVVCVALFEDPAFHLH